MTYHDTLRCVFCTCIVVFIVLICSSGGFAFLPFLWLVNVLWFFKEAFLNPAYTEQPQIKSYVKKSAMGLILWVAVLTTWITIFQHFRARWGEVGDYLSFTIPLGTA
uniref:Gamma-secretase subunit PEN-2 n=1 Tax=Sinocyclocheilus anshuiensis TaxID=1608454 RepID=A0A671R7E9_9TELE